MAKRLITRSVVVPQGDRASIDDAGSIDIPLGQTYNIGGVPHAHGAIIGSSGIAVSIIAGAGLTGGGLLTGDRILNVGAGTLITVNADDVALSNGTEQYQVPVTGATPFTSAWTGLGTFAGTALNFTSGAFHLDTPGTLTATSTNQAIDAHTHAIDSTLARSAVTLTATSPLTGGGDLTANRTLGLAGLSSLGTGNYVVGVNAGGTAWEYKQLVEGANVTITHGVGTVTIASTSGGGDVVGPASATDNAVARFNGTTGKLLQNSTVRIGDDGHIGLAGAPPQADTALYSEEVVSGLTYFGIQIAPVMDSDNLLYGGWFSAAYIGSGANTNPMIGLFGKAVSQSTSTLAQALGTVGAVHNLSTGTITSAAALWAEMANGGGGSIGTLYGLYVPDYQVGVTTGYGVYIGGAKTYAIWVDSGASLFDGTVTSLTTITSKPVGTAGIRLDPNAATGNFTLSLSPANLTADRRVTFGDFSGTGALGAGTLSVSSSNLVSTASHTHAITTSSNPGAAASILASSASGYLTLVGLGLGSGSPSNAGEISAVGSLGTPLLWSLKNAGASTAEVRVINTGNETMAMAVAEAGHVIPNAGYITASQVLVFASGSVTHATLSTGGIFSVKTGTSAGIALDPNAATGNFTLSLSPANLTASRRITFPDVSLSFSSAPGAAAAALMTTATGLLTIDKLTLGSASGAGAGQLIASGDLFSFSDEWGLFNRAAGQGVIGTSTPDTHFTTSQSPVSSWAGAPFVTPSAVDLTTRVSNLIVYHSGTTTRSFAYETVNVGTTGSLALYARVACTGAVERCGLRMDDGTDTNHSELALRSQGATTGLVDLIRVNNGTVTTILSGLPTGFYNLQLSAAGDTNIYVYYSRDGAVYTFLGAATSARTWTITRAGIIHSQGATAGAFAYASYFDWYLST